MFYFFGRGVFYPKNALKNHFRGILSPNLNDDVPKYLEWAKLAQYSSFWRWRWWWGPFLKKKKFGGPYGPPKYHKKTFLGPNTNDDVPRVQEGPKWARIEDVGPMDNGGAHFGPKNIFMGRWGPIKSPPNYPKMTILSLKNSNFVDIFLIFKKNQPCSLKFHCSSTRTCCYDLKPS